MKAKLFKTYKTLQPYLIPAMLVMALTVTAAPALAAPLVSTPSFSIDFSSALQTIFDYASMIFTWLIPIAAIGIGFRFGGSLLEWVGGMLGNALRFR
jgi:hypothetical protein